MPKILIVEDNEMNRDMLGRRLARRGFDICLAVDGPGGLAAAAAERPHLIIMDVGLGEMDGWEATLRLKSDPLTAAIPVIALTAHALPSDRERSLVVGCSDFDTKPVDFARLLGKIEACLAGEKREAA
jgi:CheY-like chemotaxis protein